MGAAAGYVLHLSEDRYSLLEDCFEDKRDFAQPVDDFLHSRNVLLVCFVISPDLVVTHLARARRGIIAGTGLRRLNLTDIQRLPQPIYSNTIVDHVPRRLLAGVTRCFPFGGLLTPKGFAAVFKAIRELAPENASTLDKFSSDRAETIRGLTSNVRQSLAYQKEAVITALSIAGISRDSLQQWNPLAEREPVSFLEGLPSARLREDPVIVHDLRNFPGFDLIRRQSYSAATFESESGEHLTIILANRQPLEHQTGTDLIYFNETYQCFVMVQYKMMDYDHERRTPFLRLPQTQLTKEIQAMNRLVDEMRKCDTDRSCEGFRLNQNPFFLKLCPKVIFNPDDVGLSPGLYLPLEYWNVLSDFGGLLGPRGGKRVTYDNVGRYFDNTGFALLVSKAWVGTTVKQSSVLKKAIRATLESGKAIAVAIGPPGNDRHQRRGAKNKP